MLTEIMSLQECTSREGQLALIAHEWPLVRVGHAHMYFEIVKMPELLIAVAARVSLEVLVDLHVLTEVLRLSSTDLASVQRVHRRVLRNGGGLFHVAIEMSPGRKNAKKT